MNYTASFGFFESNAKSDDPAELIAGALGQGTQVRNLSPCRSEDVQADLREALQYRGEIGSHPNADYLEDASFASDCQLILADLEELLVDVDGLHSFWLQEGHPFYPVFWDFAYLLSAGRYGTVFIGSSSD